MPNKLSEILINRVTDMDAAKESFPLLTPVETVSGWYMASRYATSDHPYFKVAVFGYKISVERGQVEAG